MEKCDGCSCRLNNKSKFNISVLQKVSMCRQIKPRLITLTEIIFYSTIFTYIYYKYETVSLQHTKKYIEK